MSRELVFFGFIARPDGRGKQYQAHFTHENGKKYVFIPNDQTTTLQINETGLWLVEPVKRVYSDPHGGFELWAVDAHEKVEGFDREIKLFWDMNYHTTRWLATAHVDGGVRTDFTIRQQDHIDHLKAPEHYRAFRHEAIWKVRGVRILTWTSRHHQIEVELATCVVQPHIPESERSKMSVPQTPSIPPRRRGKVVLPSSRFAHFPQPTLAERIDHLLSRP